MRKIIQELDEIFGNTVILDGSAGSQSQVALSNDLA